MSLAPPTAAEVVAARTAVQAHLQVGITAAQDWCADAIHVKRRAWQYYEAGRPMLLGLWELLQIKLERAGIEAHELRRGRHQKITASSGACPAHAPKHP